MRNVRKREALFVFLLLFGLLIAGGGGCLYQSATASSSESLPAGGIDIWAGPHPLANVSGAVFTVSLIDNSVTVEVYFAYPQYRTMHFWATIPFRAIDMNTWVDRNGRYQQGDNSIGAINSSFYSENGATIADASFTPLTNIPYFNVTVGLAVMFHVRSLIAKTEGATDSVVLTFFGRPLWGDASMVPCMTTDTQPVWGHPILIQIHFPSDSFLSPETFPSPVAYYATNEDRFVSFAVNLYSLDFVAHGSSLAQTVSFSFVNPKVEQKIQHDLFLGGLLLGIGIPTSLSGLTEFLKERFADPDNCSVRTDNFESADT